MMGEFSDTLKDSSTTYGQAFIVSHFHSWTDVNPWVIARDFLFFFGISWTTVGKMHLLPQVTFLNITFPCFSYFLYLMAVLEIFTEHFPTSSLQSCSHLFYHCAYSLNHYYLDKLLSPFSFAVFIHLYILHGFFKKEKKSVGLTFTSRYLCTSFHRLSEWSVTVGVRQEQNSEQQTPR